MIYKLSEAMRGFAGVWGAHMTVALFWVAGVTDVMLISYIYIYIEVLCAFGICFT